MGTPCLMELSRKTGHGAEGLTSKVQGFWLFVPGQDKGVGVEVLPQAGCNAELGGVGGKAPRNWKGQLLFFHREPNISENIKRYW